MPKTATAEKSVAKTKPRSASKKRIQAQQGLDIAFQTSKGSETSNWKHGIGVASADFSGEARVNVGACWFPEANDGKAAFKKGVATLSPAIARDFAQQILTAADEADKIKPQSTTRIEGKSIPAAKVIKSPQAVIESLQNAGVSTDTLDKVQAELDAEESNTDTEGDETL